MPTWRRTPLSCMRNHSEKCRGERKIPRTSMLLYSDICCHRLNNGVHRGQHMSEYKSIEVRGIFRSPRHFSLWFLMQESGVLRQVGIERIHFDYCESSSG